MRTALRDLRLSPSFSERGTPPPILFKDYHQVSGDWGVVSLSEGRGGEVWCGQCGVKGDGKCGCMK